MENYDYGIDVNRLEVFGDEYANAIKALLKRLQIADESYIDQCFHLKAFAKKYTLLPGLWQYWKRIESYMEPSYVKEAEQYKRFCLPRDKHFYIDYRLNDFSSDTPLQHFQRIDGLKEGLFYPHRNMDELFQKYDRNSSHALTRKEMNQYEKALSLYQTLKKVINDPAEWLNRLKEVDNLEYIIKSSEYRLSEDPYDEIYWDAYLNFLKTVDANMMLKTYSRYCRLFLFNYYMRDQYCDTIGSSEVPDKSARWTDYVKLIRMFESVYETNEKMASILFEYYDMPRAWKFSSDDFDQNMKMFIDLVKSKEKPVQYLVPNVLDANVPVTENIVKPPSQGITFPMILTPAYCQRFSFKATYIRYLLDHASPRVLQKLQMACKQLYLAKELVYCHRLCIKTAGVSPQLRHFQQFANQHGIQLPVVGQQSDNIQPFFYENALVVSPQHLQQINFEKYHLVNSLEIFDSLPEMTLPIFRKCSLKYLTIDTNSNFVISEEDFLFLTSKLEFLAFTNVTVTKADGTIAALEYIMQCLNHVPNIKLIDLPRASFNALTAQNLVALQRTQKLKSFCLDTLPQSLKTEQFCIFIEANVEENAELKFEYDNLLGRLLKFELGQQLRLKLHKLAKGYKLI